MTSLNGSLTNKHTSYMLQLSDVVAGCSRQILTYLVSQSEKTGMRYYSPEATPKLHPATLP